MQTQRTIRSVYDKTISLDIFECDKNHMVSVECPRWPFVYPVFMSLMCVRYDYERHRIEEILSENKHHLRNERQWGDDKETNTPLQTYSNGAKTFLKINKKLFRE